MFRIFNADLRIQVRTIKNKIPQNRGNNIFRDQSYKESLC